MTSSLILTRKTQSCWNWATVLIHLTALRTFDTENYEIKNLQVQKLLCLQSFWPFKRMEDLKNSLHSLNLTEQPILKTFELEGRSYKYVDLTSIENYKKLPYCLRTILECSVRKSITTLDADLRDVWRSTTSSVLARKNEQILYQPGRVVLQGTFR